MSKLQKLIEELCPNGVEYRKLGEVCLLSRGKVYSKDYIRDNVGEYPLYSSQTANNGELGRISSYDFDGEYLTWTTDGAYAGTIFYRNGKFSITNVCGLIEVLSDELNIRFLYFWLSFKAKEYVYQGMGNPKLMSNQMSQIEIPLPPLPVQEEIVKILDRFAVYAAELQARQQQYEYYRNKLLDFSNLESGGVIWNKYKHLCPNGIEYRKLGEVCEILRGRRLTKAQLSLDNKYPVFHGGIEPIGYYDNYNREANTIMIINVGASAGTVGFCDKKFWSSDGCFCVGKSDKILDKYLYYFLSNVQKEFISKVRYAGIPTLDSKVIANIEIPLPPLPVQEEVVRILDKFSILLADISQGLPAEIEARREQYEYYRNQLLTF